MASARLVFAPALLEDVRRRYEETKESVAAIVADLDICRGSFFRLVADNGWRKRSDRPPRDLSTRRKLDRKADATLEARAATRRRGGAATDAAVATDVAGLADRLAAAAEHELRVLERKQALDGGEPPSAAEAAQTARLIAQLTDTLTKVRRLRAPDVPMAGRDDAADDDPADADEFRRLLARKMDDFIRARRDAGLDPG